MKDDVLMDDPFDMKDHFIKTAETYFLVERFLSSVHAIRLSPLTRFALMLMLEPKCPMDVGRLATKMNVTEIFAQAALDELVCTGHVRKSTYGRSSYYKFSTEGIECLNQKPPDEYAECQGPFKDWTGDSLLP
jgi:predicted transcriptional regulator